MTSTQLRLVTTGPFADAATAATPVRTPATRPALRRNAGDGNRSRLWSAADPDIELTVVVPFYNPGLALRRTMARLVACLRAEGVGFEVIAVSDGSTDGSELTLGGLGPELRVLVSPTNEGKGAALHRGFAQARGAWVGFIDCDGDIDPVHLAEYLRIARAGNHAAVYADKRHAASQSGASGLRKLISMVYSTFVTLLFLLGIRDTQTGCKIIRRDVLAGVLPNLLERKFAFDLEFFVAARATGIKDMVAAPVRLETRLAGSTVTSKAILRTIKDTFVVFVRLHVHEQYAVAPFTTNVRTLTLLPRPTELAKAA
jgi:glycosyltransferase involved in cell wall biosynthesis